MTVPVMTLNVSLKVSALFTDLQWEQFHIKAHETGQTTLTVIQDYLERHTATRLGPQVRQEGRATINYTVGAVRPTRT